MLAKRKVLAAMAALAMLAMPVSALAAHKHGNQERVRPYASHDQGWHRGWDNHPEARQRFGRNYYQPRVNGYRPGPLAYDGGDHDDWNRGGYHRGWDADGDRYRWTPNYSRPAWRPQYATNYRCDADGDDCGGINNSGPAYWANNGGFNYGEPYSWYQAAPPTAYGPTQQIDWLIARRQRAMRVIAQMRARGDSRGAARMVPIVNALNRKISALNGRRGYGANTVYPYAPASTYVPPRAVAPAYAANNYYGTAAPYYPSTPLGALTSMAGPLFGLP